MLESRVYAWQEIDPMRLDEVLTVVPAFHPVWAGADPELIALRDREAAHGNFRAWAKITHHLTVGMKETGSKSVPTRPGRSRPPGLWPAGSLI
ncbi:hypothetical protein [Streptomyces sp. NPDC047453]|uniref:hypothetical protein n=1 Tax=Streptomyces sp. NPDC047453 TaxID=3154812 RepID=UPI0033EB9BA1